MIKKIFITILSTVLCLSISFKLFAGPAALKFPPMELGETLVYRVIEKSNGESFLQSTKVVKSEHRFESKTENGVNYVLHSCDEVRKDGVKNKWSILYSKQAPGIKTNNYIFRKFTPNGKLYYYEEYHFNDPFLKLPPDITHIMSVPFLLSGMDFKLNSNLILYVWGQEGYPAKIDVKVIGSETIQTPLKKAETWKVSVIPDTKEIEKPMGAMGKIIAQLFPEFTIWFEKAPPHRPMKIYGVFGPLSPGRPEYIEELIEIKNRKAN